MSTKYYTLFLIITFIGLGVNLLGTHRHTEAFIGLSIILCLLMIADELFSLNKGNN